MMQARMVVVLSEEELVMLEDIAGKDGRTARSKLNHLVRLALGSRDLRDGEHCPVCGKFEGDC